MSSTSSGRRIFEAIGRDIRYAARRIRRQPTAAVIVVLTLAIAVGANATLFSLVRGIVERPLPVRAPDRLVVISLVNPRNAQQLFTYVETFDRLRSEQDVFESMSLYVGGGLLRGEARGTSFYGGVESSTDGFFESLGLRPFLGRFPTASENPPAGHAAPYVVISYRIWQRYFAGDPHALSETIRVEGVPLYVIGVAPPEFHGMYVDGGADFWVSMDFVRMVAGDPSKPLRSRTIVAQLRPGVTIEQARAKLTTIWPSLLTSTLPANVNLTERTNILHGQLTVATFATGFSTLRRLYADPLEALSVLAAVLLVIGCTNLGAIILARLLARDREIATQLALGAGAGAIIRQAAVEVLLLSSAGAAVAVWLAFGGTGAVIDFLWAAKDEPLALSVRPDTIVLAAALAVTAGAGLLVGVIPAWLAVRRMSSLNVAANPRAGTSDSRAASVLLAAQIALSLVLVACAGLFVQTVRNLRANDDMLPAGQLVLTRLLLKPGVPRPLQLDTSYYRDVIDRLSGVPTVEAVALSTYFPSSFEVELPIEPVVRGDGRDRSAEISAGADYLSPGFFETLDIGRLAGRDFTWQDDARGRPVAILNTVLANRLFPRGDAVGQQITLGTGGDAAVCEVIGIVADAPVYGIRLRQMPMAFRPLLQRPHGPTTNPFAIVRGRGRMDPVIAGYKSALAGLPYHLLGVVMTLDDLVGITLQQERLAAWGASLFAGLALLVSALGVYGLVAYAVARRTREVGVRMALGARRRTILWMITRQGLEPSLAGVALGLCGAAVAARVIRSMLYGVSPYDPITLAVAAAVFLAIGLGAGLAPGYRASTIDPIITLRED